MIKAVIFDMYETLITLWASKPYFRREMVEDMGVSVEAMSPYWDETEDGRSIGEYTFEEAVAMMLKKLNIYSDELLKKMSKSRHDAKAEAFNHIHPGIIPMLEEIHQRGYKIGLVSNCFSEESELIKESLLYKYFDAAMLSFDEGLSKPDERIFLRCLERLDLKPEECLYVGDGGCDELKVSGKLGMHPLQAVWYLYDNSGQPCKRMAEYEHLENPEDIFKYL